MNDVNEKPCKTTNKGEGAMLLTLITGKKKHSIKIHHFAY